MRDEIQMKVSKLGKLRPDECVVVDVDLGDVPVHEWGKLTSFISKAFREFLPDDVKVLIKGKTTDMCIESKLHVVSELLGIRLPVIRFAIEMEAKLLAHDDDRGERGWANDEPEALFHRVVDELEELRPLLVDAKMCDEDKLVDVIRRAQKECADVGNMTMMIHDVLGEVFNGD